MGEPQEGSAVGVGRGVLLSGEHVLICVAWPYANGPLHLGHVAGCYLPPDIQFRFERAIGNKVLMVSGSDEHGTPITVTAEQQGVAPQRVVDEFHAMNYQALLDLGCSWSMSVDPRGVEYGGALFNRTSDPRHKSMVQENFSALEQGGFFERQTMEQYYESYKLAREFARNINFGDVNLETLLFADDIEKEKIEKTKEAAEKIKAAVELMNKKIEEEAKAKAEEEAKKKAEDEAKLKAEAEAKHKAEEEAKAKAEKEAKLKAELEAKKKAEEEARLKAELEAKKKAEGARPVVKPAAKRAAGSAKANKRTKATTAMKQSGSIDDAANWLLS